VKKDRISSSDVVSSEEQKRAWKRILIVDDDPDITYPFKEGIEYGSSSSIKVYTYNDPLVALSEYDLMLLDINLPVLNGFEFYEKILELDINVKACFMSAAQINREALREIYPSISLGCFIGKPVTMDYLVNRLKAELD
jgi:DNA-binding response OmpR family regulator